ncbi:MAG: BACON domain-containing protein [Tannerellaceae bacterium]|jgi:hypothetical protein|nr:BACON domain-containing protein [Tannerellaceae bacterium]
MNKLVTISLFISLLTSLFFSCVDDERITEYVKPTEPAAMDKSVVLTMQIPGTYTPVTYAYSENDENEVRTVDVLAFKVDSAGNESYFKHITVPSLSQDNGNVKMIRFRLELVDTRLIVLANVRNLFTQELEDQLLTDAAMGGMTKEKIMQRFVFEMNEPFGVKQEPFPMYGESGVLRSSEDTAGDIKMIRSITRIDVVNSILDDKVTIDSVYLFNAKNKGFVAPAFDAKGAILGTPNMPAHATPHMEAFGYRFVQNAGTVSPAMEREIYLTEDGQDTDSPTLIVLKITRDGNPSFYRVDMRGKDGELMPVLRNYRYRLNVAKILGDGYPTAEMAASVIRPSLSSTVETNELGISSIIFNDQYKLGVSATDLLFKADGSWEGQKSGEVFNSLKVYTTYSGWSVEWEGEGLDGWLTIDGVNLTDKNRVDFPASRLDLNIKATANKTGAQRSGRLKLTAGALSLTVNIVQYS